MPGDEAVGSTANEVKTMRRSPIKYGKFMGNYGKIPKLAMEVLFAGKIIELFDDQMGTELAEVETVQWAVHWGTCDASPDTPKYHIVGYTHTHTHIYIYILII